MIYDTQTVFKMSLIMVLCVYDLQECSVSILFFFGSICISAYIISCDCLFDKFYVRI